MSGLNNSSNQYDSLINLPHHTSDIKPRMPLINRAAQFSPFAALTGYEEAVFETARVTEEKIELGEGAIEELNENFSMITDMIETHPEVAITYFVPDKYKKGGKYITDFGNIKKIDEYEKVVVLTDNKRIFIEDVFSINMTEKRQMRAE